LKKRRDYTKGSREVTRMNLGDRDICA